MKQSKPSKVENDLHETGIFVFLTLVIFFGAVGIPTLLNTSPTFGYEGVDWTPVTTMYQEAYAYQEAMETLAFLNFNPIVSSAFLVMPTTLDNPPPDPTQYFELKYGQSISLESGFIETERPEMAMLVDVNLHLQMGSWLPIAWQEVYYLVEKSSLPESLIGEKLENSFIPSAHADSIYIIPQQGKVRNDISGLTTCQSNPLPDGGVVSAGADVSHTASTSSGTCNITVFTINPQIPPDIIATIQQRTNGLSAQGTVSITDSNYDCGIGRLDGVYTTHNALGGMSVGEIWHNATQKIPFSSNFNSALCRDGFSFVGKDFGFGSRALRVIEFVDRFETNTHIDGTNVCDPTDDTNCAFSYYQADLNIPIRQGSSKDASFTKEYFKIAIDPYTNKTDGHWQMREHSFYPSGVMDDCGFSRNGDLFRIDSGSTDAEQGQCVIFKTFSTGIASFNENFDTDDWTVQSDPSRFSINTGTGKLEVRVFDDNTNSDGIFIQQPEVFDQVFTLQIPYNGTFTSGSATQEVWFAVSNTQGTNPESGLQDAVGLAWVIESTGEKRFLTTWQATSGGQPNLGTNALLLNSTDLGSAMDDGCIEIIRDHEDATWNFYDSMTCTGTPLQSLNRHISTNDALNIVNLDHVKFLYSDQLSAGTGSIDIDIDSVKIFNGMLEAPTGGLSQPDISVFVNATGTGSSDMRVFVDVMDGAMNMGTQYETSTNGFLDELISNFFEGEIRSDLGTGTNHRLGIVEINTPFEGEILVKPNYEFGSEGIYTVFIGLKDNSTDGTVTLDINNVTVGVNSNDFTKPVVRFLEHTSNFANPSPIKTVSDTGYVSTNVTSFSIDTTDLENYWKFDETSGGFKNSDISNIFPDGNSTTETGTFSKSETGIIGTAWKSPATGTNVKVITQGTPSDYDFLVDGNSTINMWIKDESCDSNNEGILSSINVASADGIRILATCIAGVGTGDFTIQYFDSSGSDSHIGDSPTGYYDNQEDEFHMYTVVHENKDCASSTCNIFWYKDGVLVDTDDAGNDDLTQTVADQTPHFWNWDADNLGLNNATYDEFSLWSRQLSANEITSLYNGGSGLELTDVTIPVASPLPAPKNPITGGTVTSANSLDVDWIHDGINTTGYRIYRTSTEATDTKVIYDTLGSEDFAEKINAVNVSVAHSGLSVVDDEIISELVILLMNDTGMPVTSNGLIRGAIFADATTSTTSNATIAISKFPNGTSTVETVNLPSGLTPFNYIFRGDGLVNLTSGFPTDIGFGVFRNTTFTGDVSVGLCTGGCAGAGSGRTFDTSVGGGTWLEIGATFDVPIKLTAINQTKLSSSAVPYINDTGSLDTNFTDTGTLLGSGNTYFYRVVPLNGDIEGETVVILNGTEGFIINQTLSEIATAVDIGISVETLPVGLTDLEIYWKFDETSGGFKNNIIANIFPDGNSTTETGTFSKSETGIIGTAWKSPATGNTIKVLTEGTPSDYDFMADGNSTFNMWIKDESCSVGGFALQWTTFDNSIADGANTQTESCGTNDIMRARYFDSSGSDSVNEVSPNGYYESDADTFDMYTIVHDNTNDLILWFKNGVLLATNTTSTDDLSGVVTDNTPILWNSADFNVGYNNGTFDEFSFWSRALSTTDVTNLYNSGQGLELDNQVLIPLPPDPIQNLALSHDNINTEIDLTWDVSANADNYTVQRLSTERQIVKSDSFGVESNFATSTSNTNDILGDGSGFATFDIPTQTELRTARFDFQDPTGGQVVYGYWLNVISGGTNQIEPDVQGEVNQTGFMVSHGTRPAKDCSKLQTDYEQDGWTQRSTGKWYDGNCQVEQRYLGTQLKNLTVAETANAEVTGVFRKEHTSGEGFVVLRPFAGGGSGWVFQDSAPNKWFTTVGIEQKSQVMNQTFVNITTTSNNFYSDDTANNYNSYFYRIVPLNGALEGDPSSIVNGTLSLPPLRVPDLNATDNGATVDLVWEEAPIKKSRELSEDPVQGYIIQRATGGNETTIYDGLSHDVEEFILDGTGLTTDTLNQVSSNKVHAGQQLNITEAVNITRIVVKVGCFRCGSFNVEPDVSGSIHFLNGTQISRSINPRIATNNDLGSSPSDEGFVNWIFSPPVHLEPDEYIFGYQQLGSSTCVGGACATTGGRYMQVFFEETGVGGGSSGWAVGEDRSSGFTTNPINGTKDKDYAMQIFAETTWDTIGTNLGATNTTFTDSSPPQDVTKAYRVLAFNDAGVSHQPTLLHNPQGTTVVGMGIPQNDFFRENAQGVLTAGTLNYGEMVTFEFTPPIFNVTITDTVTAKDREDSIVNLMSFPFELSSSVILMGSDPDRQTFDGYIGNQYNSSEIFPQNQPIKVKGVYVTFMFGNSTDPTTVADTGTMTAVVLQNVTLGGSQSDVVTIAESDAFDLTVQHNYTIRPPRTNGGNFEESVVFNFTGTDVTLQENSFIGFRLENVDINSTGFNTKFVFETYRGLDGQSDPLPKFNGEGRCLSVNSTDTFGLCSGTASPDGAPLGIEIGILVEDTSTFTTTGGIAPDKLIIHHTFDSETLYDSAYPETLFKNAGTLQELGDISVLNNFGVQTNQTRSTGAGNPSGLMGEAGYVGGAEDQSNDGFGFYEIGFSDINRAESFTFFTNNENLTDTYSMNLWINGNFSDADQDYLPLISIANTDGDNSFVLGATLSDEITFQIFNNDQEVMASEITSETFFEGTWEMITMIVEKSNSTDAVIICVNNVCESFPRGNAWEEDQTILDNRLLIGDFLDRNFDAFDLANAELGVAFLIDELCIWKDYKLTPADVATLYNSDDGLPCGTVTETSSGLTVALEPKIANVTITDTVNAKDREDSIVNLMSLTYEDDANLKIIDTGLGEERFDGYVGNLYFSPPDGLHPQNQPIKIKEVFVNFQFGSTINASQIATTGNMTAVVLQNVTLGGSQSDVVTIAESDVFDLTVQHNYTVRPTPFDLAESVVFNFTGTDLTFTNGTFIGFRIQDLFMPDQPINNEFNLEGYEFTQGDLTTGQGQCVIVNSTDTFAKCPIPLATDSLGLEIGILVEDTPTFTTTGGIEPDKLIVHHTFDSETLLDSAYPDTLFKNAGTLQGLGDISVLNNNAVQTNQSFVSTTGLLGEGGYVGGTGGVSTDGDGLYEIGFSDAERTGNFNFIANNETSDNVYSINLWLNGTWSDMSGDFTPILTNTNSLEEQGMVLGVINSGELTYSLISKDQEVILNDETTATLTDDTWGMVSIIVDKTNSTHTVQVCIDTTCNPISAPFSEFSTQTGIDNKMMLGDMIIDNFEWHTLSVSEPTLAFSVDELCIWKDHKLTPSQLTTLYNSGSGANCGTVSETSGGLTVTFIPQPIFNETAIDTATVSDEVETTFIPAPPLPPTNVSSAQNGTDITITWTKEATADGYKILRKATNDTTSKVKGDDLPNDYLKLDDKPVGDVEIGGNRNTGSVAFSDFTCGGAQPCGRAQNFTMGNQDFTLDKIRLKIIGTGWSSGNSVLKVAVFNGSSASLNEILENSTDIFTSTIGSNPFPSGSFHEFDFDDFVLLANKTYMVGAYTNGSIGGSINMFRDDTGFGFTGYATNFDNGELVTENGGDLTAWTRFNTLNLQIDLIGDQFEEIATVGDVDEFTDVLSSEDEGNLFFYKIKSLTGSIEGNASSIVNQTAPLISGSDLFNSTSKIWQFREHDLELSVLQGASGAGCLSNCGSGGKYPNANVTIGAQEGRTTATNGQPLPSDLLNINTGLSATGGDSESNDRGAGIIHFFKIFNTTKITDSSITIAWQQEANGGSTDAGLTSVATLSVFDGIINKDSGFNFAHDIPVLSNVDGVRTSVSGLSLSGIQGSSVGAGTGDFNMTIQTLNASSINWGSFNSSFATVVVSMIDPDSQPVGSNAGAYELFIANITVSQIGTWNFTNPQIIYTVDGNRQLAVDVCPKRCMDSQKGFIGERGFVNTTSFALPSVPDQVTGLTVIQNMTNNATLNWDDASGADNYQVFRNSTLIGSPTTSEFTDTAISPITNLLNYTVRGNNTQGFGLNSTIVQFGLIQPIAGLTANATNSTTIKLSWNQASTVHPSDPLTGVIIQRANSTGFEIQEWELKEQDHYEGGNCFSEPSFIVEYQSGVLSSAGLFIINNSLAVAQGNADTAEDLLKLQHAHPDAVCPQGTADPSRGDFYLFKVFDKTDLPTTGNVTVTWGGFDNYFVCETAFPLACTSIVHNRSPQLQIRDGVLDRFNSTDFPANPATPTATGAGVPLKGAGILASIVDGRFQQFSGTPPFSAYIHTNTTSYDLSSSTLDNVTLNLFIDDGSAFFSPTILLESIEIEDFGIWDFQRKSGTDKLGNGIINFTADLQQNGLDGMDDGSMIAQFTCTKTVGDCDFGASVSLQGTGESNFTTIATVDELDTMFNDTGLDENTSYIYRAKGESAVSTGAFDIIASATTPSVPDFNKTAIDTVTVSDNVIPTFIASPVFNQTEIDTVTVSDQTDVTAVISQFVSDIVTAIDNLVATTGKSSSDTATTSDQQIITSPPFPITTLSASTVGNTCELSWSAPPNGNSPIIKYQIFRAVSSGSFSLLLNQTFVNHTDTGLVNNVLYEYNVTSINAFGDSEPSNIENCMPIVSTVPNAPSLTDVNEEPNGDVTIDWIASTEGSPTGYKIERKVGGGGFLVLVANTGNSLVTFTDTTTSPATQFTYRISGINAFGTGAPSNEGSITTASPPNAPLLSGAQNGDQIDISWTVPASANPINGYKIDRRINLGAFTIFVANTSSTLTTFSDSNVTKPDIFGYRVRALSSAGEGTVSNIIDITFGSHVIVEVREQDGSGFKGGGIVTGQNSTFNLDVGLDVLSNAVFDNLAVGNFNFTFIDSDDFILNKTFNFPAPAGNDTSTLTINALVFDVDCPDNGLGTDLRIKVNYTDAKDITEFPSTPVCDSTDQVSWSTRWQGDAVNDTSTMIADFISPKFRANAETFLASAEIIPTVFNSSPNNQIVSDGYVVNMTDVTINFNLFMGRAPQTGGGGSGGSGSQPTPQITIPDPDVVFADRLTGLSILSRTHQFAQAGDVIEGSITVNWEGEDNLTVKGIDIINSELDIRFDLVPFPLDQIVEGTGEFAMSSAEIPYIIVLPPNECNVEIGITQNCFDPTLHTLPVEFLFGLGDQEYEASTEIFVDGRPIPIDIVQLQIILLFLVLVASAVFGNFIRNKFKKSKSRSKTTKKKFKKKFDSS